MPRSQDEFRLTCVVADYLALAYPRELPWSHWPAGEARSEVTGARLKRMGVKRGWPDFILNLPGGRVGYIELKTPSGRLSPEQQAFRDAVAINGARWSLCRSLDDVKATLSTWLEKPQ